MLQPNIVLKYKRAFSKSVRHLPAEIKRKLTQVLNILARDPCATGLQLEKLKVPAEPIYSVRLSHEFRLIFRRLRCGTIELLCVGNHKFAYRPY